ncbi:hypothetical protein BKN38_04560 [Helicobacter sp. CLO-3]|uniref:SPOR domain-containing protein n=1 Tax=unclassified Helicobacter TaxID=2593540 RepID=UPI0008052979|nr:MULTISPECIES: SPOR domain-containing protein [unclassified Helicobacter]OBV29816.1 hypothetical protein BA723_04055 [Helicobacter sp. CLO-3]OHU83966.1 hypothetical protein BKN38_04560 [Helicobacter sp. CLO-3]
MTEDRKELSEILLGNTKQSSNGKKAVLIVIASIVIIAVVAFGMWKLLGSKEEKVAKPSSIVDTDIMKPATKDFGDDFGMGNNPSSNDFGSLDFANTPLQPQDLGFGLENDGANDANNGFGLQDDINSANAGNSIDDALKAIEDSIKSEPQKPAQTAKEPAKPSAPAATKDSAKEPAKSTPKAESKPDSKIDSKPAAKEPAKPSAPAQSTAKDSAKEPAKPAPKADSSKDSAKDSGKLAQAHAPAQNTPAQSASTQAPAPASTSSAQTTARNGSAPTQGFYWQVGAFEKEPNAEFMALIKKYPYRIQHTKIDNIPTTRYLIGPYASRPQAPNREEIANIFKENPTPVEIQ